MLVLLEGPDGAGKSTLAAQLEKWLPGAITIHHGSYKGYDGQSLASTYMASMKPALVGKNVIMDRCWLSEPIYGAVYRGQPSRISSANQRMLERAALKSLAIVVRCLPPFHVCAEAFTSGRDEMLDDVNQLKQVYDLYEAAPWVSHVPRVDYDWTTETFDDLTKKIKEAAFSFLQLSKVVLLGDRPNVRTHEQAAFSVPFVSFNGLGCSGWLAEQLDSEDIPEQRLYWANAFNHDGMQLHKSCLLDPEKRIKVIALGRNASGWCLDNGISHQLVPHPQAHKRFHFGKPYPLIKEIKRALHDVR